MRGWEVGRGGEVHLMLPTSNGLGGPGSLTVRPSPSSDHTSGSVSILAIASRGVPRSELAIAVGKEGKEGLPQSSPKLASIQFTDDWRSRLTFYIQEDK